MTGLTSSTFLKKFQNILFPPTAKNDIVFLLMSTQGRFEGRRGVSGGASQQSHSVDNQSGRPERGTQSGHPALPQKGSQLWKKVSKCCVSLFVLYNTSKEKNHIQIFKQLVAQTMQEFFLACFLMLIICSLRATKVLSYTHLYLMTVLLNFFYAALNTDPRQRPLLAQLFAVPTTRRDQKVID